MPFSWFSESSTPQYDLVIFFVACYLMDRRFFPVKFGAKSHYFHQITGKN